MGVEVQIHTAKFAAATSLAEVHGRITAWREAGRPGNRIPEEIWSAAVELARSVGVFQVTQALGLDYTKLKGLVGTATEMASQRPARSAESLPPGPESPRFIEIAQRRHVPIPEAPSPCSIELAFPDGRKITIRDISDGTAVSLCETFWTADR